jgi:hypothetical protein
MIATPLCFSYPSIQSKVSRNTTYVIYQNVGQLHVSILYVMMIRASPLPPLPPTPMAWQPRVDEGLSRLHDHTQRHHTRQDSSGRLISPSQRPLPDNTQHSQQTPMPPPESEPAIPASERPQIHALGSAASGIGDDPCIGSKHVAA